MRQRTVLASSFALVTVVLLVVAACTTTTTQPGATSGSLAEGAVLSDPPGWTRFTSPWLGYSIALPPGFELYDHIPPSTSQGSYDLYSGPGMSLAVAVARLAEGETPQPIRADVLADGLAFQVNEPEGDAPGGVTLIAGAYDGDRVYALMADTSNTAASKAMFRQIVATFRPPPPGFVEPTPAPYEPDDPASSRPVLVDALPPAVAIAVGRYFVCAVTSSGRVKCWGDNGDGQLGDGTTESSATPVDVVGLTSGITGVAAHVSHVCALTSDGEVKCWGENRNGELGDGTTEDSATPVDVAGLGSKAAAVAVGASHTCVLTINGGVKCWGGNDYGQLGNGTTEDSATPVDVVGLKSGVVAISAAILSSCALTSDGGVKCWGDNYDGQLGNGTNEDSTTPVDVVGLKTGVVAISGSADTMCAISRGGAVQCWGDNEFGTLGNGTTISSSTPVDVTGLGSGATAIAVGSHACAIVQSGGVRCWGLNHYGELGDGTWTDSSVPVDVVALDTGATAIGAHYYNSCALASGGRVMCWGDDSQGQLGRGGASDSARSDTPTALPPTDADEVDADSD